MGILQKVLASDPSARPPKKWWNKMYKEIKDANPDYSEDRIDNTIGDIWYHQLSEAKKSEIRAREGKTYKPVVTHLEAVLASSK